MAVDLASTADHCAERDPQADGWSPGEALTHSALGWPWSQPWDREEGSYHPSYLNMSESNFYNTFK